jgi:hypothetical protein
LTVRRSPGTSRIVATSEIGPVRRVDVATSSARASGRGRVASHVEMGAMVSGIENGASWQTGPGDIGKNEVGRIDARARSKRKIKVRRTRLTQQESSGHGCLSPSKTSFFLYLIVNKV